MSGRSTTWLWVRRVVFAAFGLTVATLLIIQARQIEWHKVGEAMLATEPLRLALAFVLAFTSYLTYASFDLLGRSYVRHRIPRGRVLSIGAISYAFNLNLGALIGSAGFRYRMYSQQGIAPADIARIIAIAIGGNWSGYLLLGGGLLVTQRLPVPEEWALGAGLMRGIGMAMLAIGCAYPLLCAWWPERRWEIRGHVIELPSLRIALLQLTLSICNWLAITATVWILLRSVDFMTVLAGVLMAAVAGALAHIPAGLGVVEAVFVMLLSDSMETHRIVASLMTYRGVYYLAPLLVAIVLYLRLEHRGAVATPDRDARQQA